MKKHLMPVALATSLLSQHLAPFIPLSVEASAKTGLVQLWQEIPSGQEMPKGMTESELKEQLYCRLNHTLTPASTEQSYHTYVNSCYVDDVLYLGESNDQFKVYISGYEGWVNKKKASKVTLSFNVNESDELVPVGTEGSFSKDYDFTVYTTARFLETTQDATYDLTRQGRLKESDYVKYEGDFLKSATSFEEQSSTFSLAQGSIQSPSYYSNEKGQLVHYISENIAKANAYTKTVVGLAPSWMKAEQPYYSYDGIYFYTHLSMIQPSGVGAVNEGNPYYNYYQYASVRSQSQLTSADLDSYTASKGYYQTPSRSTLKSNESQLVGAGSSFAQSQSTYGVNQTIQYAMAIHESAFGRSSLSVKKNNLFGMNAADLDPTGMSSAFNSVEEGILYHADAYLSKGYTDPLQDSRYFGAHLGNKGSGMNVKYSSDPYWGEKIAGIYHQIDKANQYEDLNYYRLGVIEKASSVSVYQSPSTTSNVLYQVRNNRSNETFKHAPFLIVGESGDFYQVKTDTPLTSSGTPKFDATYQWDRANGYVLKSDISQVINGSYEASNTAPILSVVDEETPDESLKERNQGEAKGTILVSSLRIRAGKGSEHAVLGSLKQGQTVSILEIGSDWHKITYNGKVGYISADYVEVTRTSNDSTNETPNEDKPTDSDSNSTLTALTGIVNTNDLKVRTGAGTSHSILGKLAKGTKVEIVEKGTDWHRIKYGSGYGYVSANYINFSKNESETTKPTEVKNATISYKKDLVVELGSEPDLLKDVLVSNVGDQGYILDVRENGLDLFQVGTYEIEYVAKYGENFANELTKTRKVIVKDTTAPTLTLKGDEVITLNVGEAYKELGVSVKDNSGEVIKYQISDNNFNTSVQGVYRVVYTATDSSGNSNSITREVRVQDPNAPILTLKGETYMVLRGGEAYVEPGYEAFDGNGTPLKVAVIGAHFDYRVNGQYTIEYIAENAQGIKAVATRVVVVKDGLPAVEQSTTYIGTLQSSIDNLNVRAGSSMSDKVLGKLSSSDVFKVYSFEDGWYCIDFFGAKGYVHQEYVNFTEGSPIQDELPMSPDTEVTPLPDSGILYPNETPQEEITIPTPELELPTEDLEDKLINPSLITYLAIGFGICLSIVLGITGTLLYNNFKARRVSQDPHIHRSPEPFDTAPHYFTEEEVDDDSSFPNYF